jgi:gamma-glutamyltranspeptidase/glutathione hydrolase
MIADMRIAPVLVLLASIMPAQNNHTVTGSPNDWPDRDQYLALDVDSVPSFHPMQKVHSAKAVIAGVTNPFAVHAGLETLKRGGSAADAVLTTALAQIALNAGVAMSYAGILTAVYYDANSGKVYSLNAGWNTPRNETEQLSIPRPGTAFGRTALVPGLMAGVQALHERFGQRPFAELFEPSIWLADRGFPLPPLVAAWRSDEAASLARLEHTRRIFQNEDGKYYDQGDIFHQPQLAQTLKQIASQGAQYMYRGAWAHRFVDAVEREGGKITLQDMADYHPLWSEPARAMYNGYEVASLGLPSLGGLGTLSALLLAESAKMSNRGDYWHSADGLYALIQIGKLATVLTFAPEDDLPKIFPNLDLALDSRLTPTTTKRLATILRDRNWFANALGTGPKPGPNHSSSVAVVDEQGNVAALVHTCNCLLWGTTGIFVDGISIPDAADYQQAAIARTEPGGRLADSTIPVIALRDKRPVLASATIGGYGLLDVTLQNLINVLDLGMDPQASVDRPNFHGPFWGFDAHGPAHGEPTKEVLDRGFPDSVINGLKKRGQGVYVGADAGMQTGYWIGIQIDPKNGALSGGASRRLNSLVEGY